MTSVQPLLLMGPRKEGSYLTGFPAGRGSSVESQALRGLAPHSLSPPRGMDRAGLAGGEMGEQER